MRTPLKIRSVEGRRAATRVAQRHREADHDDEREIEAEVERQPERRERPEESARGSDRLVVFVTQVGQTRGTEDLLTDPDERSDDRVGDHDRDGQVALARVEWA